MTEVPAAIPPTEAVSGKRGIVYLKWGPKDATLHRSVDSVRAYHPELPIFIHECPPDSTLLAKAAMMGFTPFEETLFLDLDTIVMGRLDFGFEMAVRHGIACCICECPWARRYNGIRAGELVEYNTGVLFFTKKARPIFDAWKANVHLVDSSCKFYANETRVATSPCDDQAAFALAIAEAPTLPFVLPINWNFRPHWHRAFFGPLKIWHGYAEPSPKLVEFSRVQSLPGSIIQGFRL